MPCLHGAQVVRDIFQGLNSPRLWVHLAWIPMLPADTREAAAAQGAAFQGERVIHYWDGERALGGMVAKTLQLAEPVAWDVYLVFSPNTPWNGETLPAPGFWMHQLNERPDRYLDKRKLRAVIHESVYS